MASKSGGFCVPAVALAIVAIVSGCGGEKTTATSGRTATSNLKAVFPHLEKATAAPQGTKSRVARYRIGTYRNMSQFLTLALNRVDAFWTQVFRNSGIPEPFVRYNWLRPGESVQPWCSGGRTDDETAMYCGDPRDDTIYISQQMAINFWKGFVNRRRARVYPGAFGLTYVVAHEYGHNIQTELGIRVTRSTVEGLELQADCLAGVFANSEYYAGVLDAGDVNRAITLADLIGDYNFTNPQHHGTPAERVAAWKLGYNTGEPDRCRNTYLP
jgi:predicted metalloprotease